MMADGTHTFSDDDSGPIDSRAVSDDVVFSHAAAFQTGMDELLSRADSDLRKRITEQQIRLSKVTGPMRSSHGKQFNRSVTFRDAFDQLVLTDLAGRTGAIAESLAQAVPQEVLFPGSTSTAVAESISLAPGVEPPSSDTPVPPSSNCQFYGTGTGSTFLEARRQTCLSNQGTFLTTPAPAPPGVLNPYFHTWCCYDPVDGPPQPEPEPPLPFPEPEPGPNPRLPPDDCPPPEACPETCYWLRCGPPAEIVCTADERCPREPGLIFIGRGCPSLSIIQDMLLKCGNGEEEKPPECRLCINCSNGRIEARVIDDDNPLPSGYICLEDDRASIDELQREIMTRCRIRPAPQPEPPPAPRVPIVGCEGLPGSVTGFSPGDISGIVGQVLVGWLAEGFTGGLVGGAPSFDAIAGQIAQVGANAGRCQPAALGGLISADIALSLARRWIGDSNDWLNTIIEQQLWCCVPVRVPGPEAAVTSYLRGGAHIDTARTWVAGNGIVPEWFNTAVEAGRSKLNPAEVMELYWRGHLPIDAVRARIRSLGFVNNEEAEFYDISRRLHNPLDVLNLRRRRIIDDAQYEHRMRQLHFDAAHADEFRRVMEVVPPFSDLIRLMVRDSFDDNAAQAQGYDTDFSAKYTQEAEEYGEALGVPKRVAQLLWRAHWHLPSPEQLYDMMHRSWDLPDDDPIKVSEQDVEDALKINDLAPRWVKPMIARSQRLLTRRDMLRLRSRDAMSRDEMIGEFRRLGYDQRRAEILANGAETDGRRAALNNKWLDDAAKGHISEPELQQLLDQDRVPRDWRPEMLQRVGILREAERRKRCLESIKHRVLTGEYDTIGAASAIVSLGIDQATANILADQYVCERDSRGREVGAQQLCTWLDQGLISGPEYAERLIRLRYRRVDAQRILASCQQKITDRQAKAAERAARETAREERRVLEQRRRNADRARAAIDRRERVILATAARLSQRWEIDYLNALDSVRAVYNNMHGQYRSRLDDLVEAIDSASRPATTDSPDALERAARGIMEREPIAPIPSNGNGAPSNGDGA